MDFINSHRPICLMGLFLRCLPRIIRPMIIPDICDDRCIFRSHLTQISIGIRFIKNIPGLGPDHVFVKFAFTYPRNKGIINSKSLHRIHWIFINIPAIKVTNNRNSGRIRRPYSKIRPGFPVLFRQMGSQLFINFIMSSGFEQIIVKSRNSMFHINPSFHLVNSAFMSLKDHMHPSVFHRKYLFRY